MSTGLVCCRSANGPGAEGAAAPGRRCAFALAAFARDEQIAAEHRAVPVLDQAGWRPSPNLTRPAGLGLIVLPPDSSDLAPAGRWWRLADAPLVNRSVASLDDLESVLVARCQDFAHQRAWITSLTRSQW